MVEEKFLKCPYWTKEHYDKLIKAETFKDASNVTLEVLEKMPNGLTQICGPLTTGTFPKEVNIKIFERSVVELRVQGIECFDQTALEIAVRKLRKAWKEEHNGYCMPILEEIYGPIFKSGKITKTFFLPDWENSFGTKWERDLVYSLGIEINEFPKEWHDKILKELKLDKVVVI